MSLRVRDAAPDDAASIARVHVESSEEAYRPLATKWEAPSVVERTQMWAGILEKAVGDPARVDLVAEVDGQVVGFICVGPPRREDVDAELEVYVIHVLPKHRDQGVGSQLWRRATDLARGRQLRSLYVATFAELPCCRFYERRGAQIVVQVRGTYQGGAVTELVYRWGEGEPSVPQSRPVIVVDHDPAWADQFSELRDVLAACLGDAALRIEHVGSTSVPGLAAKPILDIDVVIEDRSLLPVVIERLNTLGYHHRGDLDVPGREAFGPGRGTRPVVEPPRTWQWHNLYVCAQDNTELRRHLAFRDWLRSHDDDARRYAALKRELARQHPNDVDAYCDAKTEFVEGILARASKAP